MDPPLNFPGSPLASQVRVLAHTHLGPSGMGPGAGMWPASVGSWRARSGGGLSLSAAASAGAKGLPGTTNNAAGAAASSAEDLPPFAASSTRLYVPQTHAAAAHRFTREGVLFTAVVTGGGEGVHPTLQPSSRVILFRDGVRVAESAPLSLYLPSLSTRPQGESKEESSCGASFSVLCALGPRRWPGRHSRARATAKVGSDEVKPPQESHPARTEALHEEDVGRWVIAVAVNEGGSLRRIKRATLLVFQYTLCAAEPTQLEEELAPEGVASSASLHHAERRQQQLRAAESGALLPQPALRGGVVHLRSRGSNGRIDSGEGAFAHQLGFISHASLGVLRSDRMMIVDLEEGSSGGGLWESSPTPTVLPIQWERLGGYRRFSVCPLTQTPHLALLSLCRRFIDVFPHASVEDEAVKEELQKETDALGFSSGGARTLSTSTGLYSAMDAIFSHFDKEKNLKTAARGEDVGGALQYHQDPIQLSLGHAYRGASVEWRCMPTKVLLCIPCRMEEERIGASPGSFSVVLLLYELLQLPIYAFSTNVHRRTTLAAMSSPMFISDTHHTAGPPSGPCVCPSTTSSGVLLDELHPKFLPAAPVPRTGTPAAPAAAASQRLHLHCAYLGMVALFPSAVSRGESGASVASWCDGHWVTSSLDSVPLGSTETHYVGHGSASPPVEWISFASPLLPELEEDSGEPARHFTTPITGLALVHVDSCTGVVRWSSIELHPGVAPRHVFSDVSLPPTPVEEKGPPGGLRGVAGDGWMSPGSSSAPAAASGRMPLSRLVELYGSIHRVTWLPFFPMKASALKEVDPPLTLEAFDAMRNGLHGLTGTGRNTFTCTASALHAVMWFKSGVVAHLQVFPPPSNPADHEARLADPFAIPASVVPLACVHHFFSIGASPVISMAPLVGPERSSSRECQDGGGVVLLQPLPPCSRSSFQLVVARHAFLRTPSSDFVGDAHRGVDIGVVIEAVAMLPLADQRVSARLCRAMRTPYGVIVSLSVREIEKNNEGEGVEEVMEQGATHVALVPLRRGRDKAFLDASALDVLGLSFEAVALVDSLPSLCRRLQGSQSGSALEEGLRWLKFALERRLLSLDLRPNWAPERQSSDCSLETWGMVLSQLRHSNSEHEARVGWELRTSSDRNAFELTVQTRCSPSPTTITIACRSSTGQERRVLEVRSIELIDFTALVAVLVSSDVPVGAAPPAPGSRGSPPSAASPGRQKELWLYSMAPPTKSHRSVENFTLDAVLACPAGFFVLGDYGEVGIPKFCPASGTWVMQYWLRCMELVGHSTAAVSSPSFTAQEEHSIRFFYECHHEFAFPQGTVGRSKGPTGAAISLTVCHLVPSLCWGDTTSSCPSAQLLPSLLLADTCSSGVVVLPLSFLSRHREERVGPLASREEAHGGRKSSDGPPEGLEECLESLRPVAYHPDVLLQLIGIGEWQSVHEILQKLFTAIETARNRRRGAPELTSPGSPSPPPLPAAAAAVREGHLCETALDAVVREWTGHGRRWRGVSAVLPHVEKPISCIASPASEGPSFPYTAPLWPTSLPLEKNGDLPSSPTRPESVAGLPQRELLRVVVDIPWPKSFLACQDWKRQQSQHTLLRCFSSQIRGAEGEGGLRSVQEAGGREVLQGLLSLLPCVRLALLHEYTGNMGRVTEQEALEDMVWSLSEAQQLSRSMDEAGARFWFYHSLARRRRQRAEEQWILYREAGGASCTLPPTDDGREGKSSALGGGEGIGAVPPPPPNSFLAFAARPYASNDTVSGVPRPNPAPTSTGISYPTTALSSTCRESSYVWALMSDAQSVLVDRLFPAGIGSGTFVASPAGAVQSSMSLSQQPVALQIEDLRESGVAYWLRDEEQLRALVERLAYAAYQSSGRHIPSCATYFILSQKLSTLAALCKSQNDLRLEAFFKRDFRLAAHRNSASANAFAAVSKNMWLYGIGFFVLAGDVKAAAQVAIQRLHDPALALLILRLTARSGVAAASSGAAAGDVSPSLDLRALLDWFEEQRSREAEVCGLLTSAEATCLRWLRPATGEAEPSPVAALRTLVLHPSYQTNPLGQIRYAVACVPLIAQYERQALAATGAGRRTSAHPPLLSSEAELIWWLELGRWSLARGALRLARAYYAAADALLPVVNSQLQESTKRREEEEEATAAVAGPSAPPIAMVADYNTGTLVFRGSDSDSDEAPAALPSMGEAAAPPAAADERLQDLTRCALLQEEQRRKLDRITLELSLVESYLVGCSTASSSAPLREKNAWWWGKLIPLLRALLPPPGFEGCSMTGSSLAEAVVDRRAAVEEALRDLLRAVQPYWRDYVWHPTAPRQLLLPTGAAAAGIVSPSKRGVSLGSPHGILQDEKDPAGPLSSLRSPCSPAEEDQYETCMAQRMLSMMCRFLLATLAAQYNIVGLANAVLQVPTSVEVLRDGLEWRVRASDTSGGEPTLTPTPPPPPSAAGPTSFVPVVPAYFIALRHFYYLYDEIVRHKLGLLYESDGDEDPAFSTSLSSQLSFFMVKDEGSKPPIGVSATSEPLFLAAQENLSPSFRFHRNDKRDGSSSFSSRHGEAAVADQRWTTLAAPLSSGLFIWFTAAVYVDLTRNEFYPLLRKFGEIGGPTEACSGGPCALAALRSAFLFMTLRLQGLGSSAQRVFSTVSLGMREPAKREEVLSKQESLSAYEVGLPTGSHGKAVERWLKLKRRSKHLKTSSKKMRKPAARVHPLMACMLQASHILKGDRTDGPAEFIEGNEGQMVFKCFPLLHRGASFEDLLAMYSSATTPHPFMLLGDHVLLAFLRGDVQDLEWLEGCLPLEEAAAPAATGIDVPPAISRGTISPRPSSSSLSRLLHVVLKRCGYCPIPLAPICLLPELSLPVADYLIFWTTKGPETTLQAHSPSGLGHIVEQTTTWLSLEFLYANLSSDESRRSYFDLGASHISSHRDGFSGASGVTVSGSLSCSPLSSSMAQPSAMLPSPAKVHLSVETPKKPSASQGSEANTTSVSLAVTPVVHPPLPTTTTTTTASLLHPLAVVCAIWFARYHHYDDVRRWVQRCLFLSAVSPSHASSSRLTESTGPLPCASLLDRAGAAEQSLSLLPQRLLLAQSTHAVECLALDLSGSAGMSLAFSCAAGTQVIHGVGELLRLGEAGSEDDEPPQPAMVRGANGSMADGSGYRASSPHPPRSATQSNHWMSLLTEEEAWEEEARGVCRHSGGQFASLLQAARKPAMTAGESVEPGSPLHRAAPLGALASQYLVAHPRLPYFIAATADGFMDLYRFASSERVGGVGCVGKLHGLFSPSITRPAFSNVQWAREVLPRKAAGSGSRAPDALRSDGGFVAAGLRDGSLAVWPFFAFASRDDDGVPVWRTTSLFARDAVWECCFCGSGDRVLAALGEVEEPHSCPYPAAPYRPGLSVSSVPAAEAGPSATVRLTTLLLVSFQAPPLAGTALSGQSSAAACFTVVARVTLPFPAVHLLFIPSMNALLCLSKPGEACLYDIASGQLMVLSMEPLWLVRRRQFVYHSRSVGSGSEDRFTAGVSAADRASLLLWEPTTPPSLHGTSHGAASTSMASSGSLKDDAIDSESRLRLLSPLLSVTTMALREDSPGEEGYVMIGTSEGIAYFLPLRVLIAYINQLRITAVLPKELLLALNNGEEKQRGGKKVEAGAEKATHVALELGTMKAAGVLPSSVFETPQERQPVSGLDKAEGLVEPADLLEAVLHYTVTIDSTGTGPVLNAPHRELLAAAVARSQSDLAAAENVSSSHKTRPTSTSVVLRSVFAYARPVLLTPVASSVRCAVTSLIFGPPYVIVAGLQDGKVVAASMTPQGWQKLLKTSPEGAPMGGWEVTKPRKTAVGVIG